MVSETPIGGLISNSGLSPTAPIGVKKHPTDKTCVVFMCRRVPTNWVSGRTLLQPSTLPDFLVGRTR